MQRHSSPDLATNPSEVENLHNHFIHLNAEDKLGLFINLNTKDQFELICALGRNQDSENLEALIKGGMNLTFYHQGLNVISVAARDKDEWTVAYLLEKYPSLLRDVYIGRGLAGDTEMMDQLYDKTTTGFFSFGHNFGKCTHSMKALCVLGTLSAINHNTAIIDYIAALPLMRDKQYSENFPINELRALDNNTFSDQRLIMDWVNRHVDVVYQQLRLLMIMIEKTHTAGITNFADYINHTMHIINQLYPSNSEHTNNLRYVSTELVAQYYGIEVAIEFSKLTRNFSDFIDSLPIISGLILGLHTNAICHQLHKCEIDIPIEHNPDARILVATAINTYEYLNRIDLTAALLNDKWPVRLVAGYFNISGTPTQKLLEIFSLLKSPNTIQEIVNDYVRPLDVEPLMERFAQIQDHMQRYKMTFKQAVLAISQLSNPILTGRTSPTLWKGTTNNPDESTSATPRDNSRNTLR